jgi:hypothetical protein
MSDDSQMTFKELYEYIDNGGLSKGEKGKKLEELSTLLFQKSVENLFDVYRNSRASIIQVE